MRTNKLPFFSRITPDADIGRDTRRASPSTSSLGSKKLAWKRFALGATVLIVLVILLGPRQRREKVLKFGQGWLESGSDISKIPSARPHSPDTDPDPEKTVHCAAPQDPSKPLVQYALMIDAGSTGSRIHIYKFHNCFSQPTYEYEVFRQDRPGLSSFKDSPASAAESLDVLLNLAVEVVPKSLHFCTPVAVKATAGLRVLGAEVSARILEAVKRRLETRYPFPLSQQDSVVIMDGKDEGVYAWITANYLFNTLVKDTNSHSTYAVLDLGGASTQIVFEPFSSIRGGQSLLEGEHKYVLQFAGQGHELYQHSYLNYGLMAARRSVHKLVEFMSTFNKPTRHADNSSTRLIANPCLSKGTSKMVEVEMGSSTESIIMTGDDIASFNGCRRLVELVLAKDAICLLKPCSFNGVYQPSLLDTFPGGKVLLLSYFYDRIQPLIDASASTLVTKLTVGSIADLAKKVCGGEDSWVKSFGNNGPAIDELRGRPEYCLDLSFMYSLLRLGYEFEDSRDVTIAKQIDGTELGWALGAGIALVGATIECKA